MRSQFHHNMFNLFNPFIFFFFFNDTATTEIYTLSLHDALPISSTCCRAPWPASRAPRRRLPRSEEHTSELQSPYDVVCRLLLEKKKRIQLCVLLCRSKNTLLVALVVNSRE